MGRYIMALDAGTMSNRCILFDKDCKVIAVHNLEFKQHFPQPGWVEHDAKEIWKTQLAAAQATLMLAGATADEIDSIGITNQRETTVVWDKNTGKPVCNAIVWQCRRTAAFCDELKQRGLEETVRKKTGLVIDAYFSATKLHWILENVPGAREKAEKGDLLFGTVDTWLIWKLTGGKVHVTDYSNASRTMLFNIHTLQWDHELLKELNIPEQMLPKVEPSSKIFGHTEAALFGAEIPIAGAGGDQQCALFGQMCFHQGEAKNNYGTGCFLLMNTGKKPVESRHGLVTTIAWGMNDTVTYALEGSVFVAGAVLQWLRDEVGLIADASESYEAAMQVDDTEGCYVVPAFTGLGAPYWDPYARGMICGLTRGVTKNHIIRAALESIAYQSAEIMGAMEADSGIPLKLLKVDGSAAANDFLMQFQADITATDVMRPSNVETTSMGAAFYAGLATGFWKSREELIEKLQTDRVFHPSMDEELRNEKIEGWQEAIRHAKHWIKPKKEKKSQT
ncbi:MAG: glycerol kinase GlpK [Lachnospiraceae bacterium]|nr:glycerol kinase GlpK [Lachnospiraceae bacterium]